MDWSGVDYCDVFISCLDSHSDGTHSLQSIYLWASHVMLHFCPQFFWVSYSFKLVCFVKAVHSQTLWKHTQMCLHVWKTIIHVARGYEQTRTDGNTCIHTQHRKRQSKQTHQLNKHFCCIINASLYTPMSPAGD